MGEQVRRLLDIKVIPKTITQRHEEIIDDTQIFFLQLAYDMANGVFASKHAGQRG